MKRIALPLLLLLCFGYLAAELAWPQALEVCAFDNIDYRGESVTSSDGCHLLFWEQSINGAQTDVCRLFDHNYQPLWQQALPLNLPFGQVATVATADSAFVIMFSNYGIKAIKISRSGEMLWGSDGVQITNISATGPYGRMVADLQGGIYVAWGGYSDDPRNATIQHLDASGNFSMPECGVILDNSVTASIRDLMICPDNSVLVAWSPNYGVRMTRVNSLGQTIWNQPFNTTTTERYPNAYIRDLPDQAFALAVGQRTEVDIYKFDYSGTALWTEPQLALGETSIDLLTIKVKPAMDGSIFVFARAWSGTYLQKMSSEGTQVYPENIYLNQYLDNLNAVADIFPDANGACAVVLLDSNNNGERGIRVLKVSSAGSVTVYPGTSIGSQNYYPSAHAVGSEIHIEWQTVGYDECGVYVQIMDSQMQCLLGENGVSLIVGSSGVINGSPKTAVTNYGCAVMWQQSIQNNARWNLYLQRYNNWGQPLQGAHGLKLNSPGTRLSGGNVIYTDGSDLMIIWGENLGDLYSTRMQIIDANGDLLLGEWGVEIPNSRAGTENMRVSLYQGDWFLTRSSGDRIMCQKFRGTENLWGDGIELTQVHPDHPGPINAHLFSMPWLLWTVNGTMMYKRIDTDGNTMPGFPEYGLEVIDPVVEGYGPPTYKFAISGDYIHLRFQMFQPGDEGIDIVYHTVIGAQGNYLFEPVIFPEFVTTPVFFYNSDIYVVAYSYGGYRVRKYDVLGNLLLNSTINIPGYGSYWHNQWHYILSNGEHLLLANSYQDGLMTLTHMYLSEGLSLQIPTDTLISDAGAFSYVVSRNGDEVWAAWTTPYDTNYSGSLSLQRIVREGLASQDPGFQAPARPVLTSSSPNPFNPSTTISFSIPQDGKTRLTVYDIRGRLINVLMDGSLPAGKHSVVWDGKGSDGRDSASGIYFLKLDSMGESHSRKITLMK